MFENGHELIEPRRYYAKYSLSLTHFSSCNWNWILKRKNFPKRMVGLRNTMKKWLVILIIWLFIQFIMQRFNSFSLSRNSSRTNTNDRRSCSRNSTIKTRPSQATGNHFPRWLRQKVYKNLLKKILALILEINLERFGLPTPYTSYLSFLLILFASDGYFIQIVFNFHCFFT